MNDLLQKIHSVNDYERTLFHANYEKFNDHLDRWYSDLRPDQVNNNFFIPTSSLTRSDIEAAIALQKQRNLNYFMLRASIPMDQALMNSFSFTEDVTYVMALCHGSSSTWKTNTSIEIRDIQTSDIRADLLDTSAVPEQYQDIIYRNMQMVLQVAETHPDYHWLYAYQDGLGVGSVYALCHNDCIEMDDLHVHKSFRNQYIATTLMKYIAEHFHGTIYLHASASGTPKNMYAKMGFTTIETLYDYYLEWN